MMVDEYIRKLEDGPQASATVDNESINILRSKIEQIEWKQSKMM